MDSFEASSRGIGDSGPVTMSGKQDESGLSKLTITAFGKRFDLDTGHLARIHGFHANGLQLSYEAGYDELGGRTIYIVVSKGFTSGVIDKRYVVVTEHGAVRVSDKLD